MKNLTGNEAYQAMCSGQKIECRPIDSDRDFDEIANHPATVFIDPSFEFRIAVILKMIGLMQVPASIKEAPAKGTQCFVPNILIDKLVNAFKWKNSDSDLALLQRGQVHLYEQHATIHAEALIKISGGSLHNDTDKDLPNELQNIDIKHEDTMPWETSSTETSTIPLVKPNQFQIEMDTEIARDHQKLLDEILESIANAVTAVEVNAQIRYTKLWSEEQRKPVINAINKKLVELNTVNPVDASEPPSLMVQIQNAPDLTALDGFEIDIASRHSDIQPKLMDCVKARRFELENQAEVSA